MKIPLPATAEMQYAEAANRVPANRLFHRFFWLAILLGAEWVPISARVGTGRGGSSVAIGLVAFLCFLVTFGYFQVRGRLPVIAREIEGTRVGWQFIAAHIAFLIVFLSLAFVSKPGGALDLLLLASWYGAGVIAIAMAVFVF